MDLNTIQDFLEKHTHSEFWILESRDQNKPKFSPTARALALNCSPARSQLPGRERCLRAAAATLLARNSPAANALSPTLSHAVSSSSSSPPLLLLPLSTYTHRRRRSRSGGDGRDGSEACRDGRRGGSRAGHVRWRACSGERRIWRRGGYGAERGRRRGAVTEAGRI